MHKEKEGKLENVVLSQRSIMLKSEGILLVGESWGGFISALETILGLVTSLQTP